MQWPDFRAERVARGLTQMEVARRAGVHQSTVARLEARDAPRIIDIARRVLSAIRVSDPLPDGAATEVEPVRIETEAEPNYRYALDRLVAHEGSE